MVSRITFPAQTKWMGYTSAVLLTIFVLLMSILMWPLFGESPFVLFVGAVTLSAWYGGFGPGLVATLLSIILTDYFLLEPLHIPFAEPSDFAQLAVFSLIALLISWTENHRRYSEAALRQTRDELTAILNGVSDGITAQDERGRVIYSNEFAATHNGFASVLAMVETPLEEIQRRYTLFDLDGQPLRYEALPRVRVFQTGEKSSLTFRQHFLDTGEDKWIHLSSAPIKARDGTVKLAVNIFRDVTEPLEIDRLREEGAVFLRQLLDSLPIMVGVLSEDGVLLEANKMALELAGLVNDDVIGKHFDTTYWWDYSPESQDRLRTMIAQAAAGETVRHDVKIRTGANEFRILDFMISAMRDSDGQITKLVPAAVDVTERRQREDEIVTLTHRMRARNRWLDTIIANIPGIVFEAFGSPEDGGQKISFVSDYAETMLGYTPEEWVTNPHFFRERIHPDDLEHTVDRVSEIYHSGGSGTIQFRLITRVGRVVYAESRSSVLTNANGNPIGACGVIMDVTRRKEIERQLKQYMKELRRSNEELEQFAYIASHDLQEPLRKIRSYLQLVGQRYADQLDDDGNVFIGYAVDGAARMQTLIRDLLAYSRIHHKGEFEPVALNDILHHILSTFQLRIENSNACITADTLPTVHANEQQIIQLFQNLLSNALKYRKEDVPPVIHVGVKTCDDGWCFSVRDNGIGIDADQHERIFAVFQRLHHRDDYPGTGIGLAICKRVVENHGGRLWVESQPGVGTTFYFTLPSITDKPEKVHETGRNHGGRG